MASDKESLQPSNTVSNCELVKFVDNGFELEVNVSPTEDTVWLTQEQISLLFDTARSAIAYHIGNLFKNKELEEKTSVKFFDRSVNHRPSKYYNLDVILAVGYRVNSRRGQIFRRWASSVLKQYLLKGYALDSSRVLVSPENYLNLVNVVNRIDSSQARLTQRVEKLEEKYPNTNNMLFFQGQLFDATVCIEDIISSAKTDIILIDGYIDIKTLDLLSKKQKAVSVAIYTSKSNCCLSKTEISNFNKQYGKLTIYYTTEFHDRFMILDKKVLYHIGASIKDAGKKAFELSLIDDDKQTQENKQIIIISKLSWCKNFTSSALSFCIHFIIFL